MNRPAAGTARIPAAATRAGDEPAADLPAEFELITLDAAHAPRCAELEQQLFPTDSPWSEAAFRSEFAQPNTLYVGLLSAPAGPQPSQLVAYGGIGVTGPAGDLECEVHTIGVDPAYQGRGLGRALLQVLLDAADAAAAPVLLEVRTDNAPALGLYRSCGFEQIGIRRGYYQPSGADAYVMRRPPASSPSFPNSR